MARRSAMQAVDIKLALLAILSMAILTAGCAPDREIRLGDGPPMPTSSAQSQNTPTTTQPTPPTQAVRLTIIEPASGAVVTEDGFVISGTSELSATDSLWTAARGVGSPNASYQPSAQPCNIGADGRFECPTQFVGGPDDSGKSFEVLLLVADQPAIIVFQEYNDSDPASNGYPGLAQLPASAELAGSVTVQRQ